MKYSVYVYPNISRELMGSNNPYIDHLREALIANGLNTEKKQVSNAFGDLIRKSFRSDMLILNWIENLPSRRMGALQTILFALYIPFLKICRVRIVWVRHNKISHDREKWALKKFLHYILSHASDHMIIHGRDIDIPKSDKMLFIPHPNNIKQDDILKAAPGEEPVIDFLIWGSLFPYKGVREFLKYVHQHPGFSNFRIHIAGKCNDQNYWNELKSYAGDNITLENQYVGEQELQQLFRRSRFILFTYQKTSVISSGVLIDSLIACKKIIASDCGAFADMARDPQFVYLYNDFSEIVDLYQKNYKNYNLDHTQVSEFVARNSWYNMGMKIKELALTHSSTPSAD